MAATASDCADLELPFHRKNFNLKESSRNERKAVPGRVQEEACPLAGAALGHCDWGPPGRRAAFSLTTEVWRAVSSRDSGLRGGLGGRF